MGTVVDEFCPSSGTRSNSGAVVGDDSSSPPSSSSVGGAVVEDVLLPDERGTVVVVVVVVVGVDGFSGVGLVAGNGAGAGSSIVTVFEFVDEPGPSFPFASLTEFRARRIMTVPVDVHVTSTV